jgi:hypothetical protein
MKKDIIISTGGLGNQLFQIAAALSTDLQREVTVDSSIGTPRLNWIDLPDSSDFEFNGRVKFTRFHQSSYVLRKAFNLGVKVSVRSIGRQDFFDLILIKIVQFILCVYYRGFYKIQYCHGVGYTPLTKSKRASIYIGYFQSFRYIANSSQNFNFSTLLKLRSPGKQIKELVKLSKIENPIIVHIRLGDYRNEPNFGIPTTNYFVDAIHRIRSKGHKGRIWLFSDEISEAESLLRPFFNDMRCIDNVDNSSASTLEAMRLGKAYVISNSTFSFFGATLSHTVNPLVIAPSPWYLNMPTPVDLLPPDWEQMDR